jgi:hypothetical protein
MYEQCGHCAAVEGEGGACMRPPIQPSGLARAMRVRVEGEVVPTLSW